MRKINRLEYFVFISGVSVQLILLFMSTLHLFLMFLEWSFT